MYSMAGNQNFTRSLICSLVLWCHFGSISVAIDADNILSNLIDQHCVNCHAPDTRKGKLDLDSIRSLPISKNTETWEKVLRKIDARQMPPVGKRRPSEDAYTSMANYLTKALDDAAIAKPNPGRTDTFRRLNRTEYQNAIRDLLELEIDAAALLPADESSHGFDHMTVGDLPPALLNRYVQAAQKISRLAVGSQRKRPDGKTYRIRPDVTQEKHVPGLPLGTRGGTLIRHTFPSDGEYEVQIRLARDRNEEVEGLRGSHQLEFLLDRKRFAKFIVAPPKQKVANHFDDTKLNARVTVRGGPHELGVTFTDNGGSLLETKRQPLNVSFNVHRHPRLAPAIYQVSITGPFPSDAKVEPPTISPSRKRIFNSTKPGAKDNEAKARTIVVALARRAYRRPITENDLARPMTFFRASFERDGFDAGLEMALSAVLTSPHFLFKIERQAKNATRGKPYKISDLELASRLAFFLWSSIPDDELLSVAEQAQLRKPEVFEFQVRRMLADNKASSLATNFASQWLHLRNLSSKTPDGRLFPDFDDNLRQAMRRETELHFEQLVKRDGNVLDLISTDHTYLNERLAKHYRVPHVYGSRFRRVSLSEAQRRGGLLRQGSILTVTSYATRTSPVIRGNWILENILGAAAPPPPEDVPSLDAGVISPNLTVRQRLAKHRENPKCASCHNLMDPIGFSLENYDAVGRWRDLEAGRPVDSSGGLPDGSEFSSVSGLEKAILKRPKVFVNAMTEKLLTFALGRGVEYYDGPAVRRIVEHAAKQDFRFSSIVLGIVRSEPFQIRNSE